MSIFCPFMLTMITPANPITQPATFLRLSFSCLNISAATRITKNVLEPFIIDVMPTEDTDFVLSSHEGEEFIMVMEGIMEISYGKNTYLLEEGDSIYYDSIVPHHVHAYEGQAAKILAVVYTPI